MTDLIFKFENKPNKEQQKQIDEANRQGLEYLCLIDKGDTIYHSKSSTPPPWLD